MKIFIASDHAGFELKQKLAPFLRGLGHEVIDEGARELSPNDDYPDFVALVARFVATAEHARGALARRKGAPCMPCLGIIIGGSGQGEAMAANRFKGVRAAVYYGGSLDIIRLSREHNDANVLSLGARFVTEAEAKVALKLWLETPFSGDERHIRRIKKIEGFKN